MQLLGPRTTRVRVPQQKTTHDAVKTLNATAKTQVSHSLRPHGLEPTRLLRPWNSPSKNTGVGCHFLLQCMKVKGKSLSRVRLLATPWTGAHQAPPSMGFSRQEYWSGVPLPSPVRVYKGLLTYPGTGKSGFLEEVL